MTTGSKAVSTKEQGEDCTHTTLSKRTLECETRKEADFGAKRDGDHGESLISSSDGPGSAQPDSAPLAEVVVSPFGSSQSQVGPTTGTVEPLVVVGGVQVPIQPAVAPGEVLQCVRYGYRGDTLMITGVTPHGRRLTFEQRTDREGWYVVAAGRRRRPTDRELGLVVASINQEVEAARAPRDDQEEIRSAYRLASSSDQPGLPGRGLQAYRDLLLDEAEAFANHQIERLAVVAVEYQAFKRFAIRHGHRIGAAFVRALGERLQQLFHGNKKVHACHKAGKSFRLVVVDSSSDEIMTLCHQITSAESRTWLTNRVWGNNRRTHIDEINFYIGFVLARSQERKSSPDVVAQRLNDDAYRAAKLGQLKGYTSIQVAKMDYKTSIYQWTRTSEHELEELASKMVEGPAEVAAELTDYLNELIPIDLEGMAVQGDVRALVNAAIARDGFWQGSVAMRIAGERLLSRFFFGALASEGEGHFVGGFEFGDEFYGMLLEDDRFYFAWGDLNSAGSTRIRAGLDQIREAVGWRRDDGGGIVGRFLSSLGQIDSRQLFPDRVIESAQLAYEEVSSCSNMKVNDAVDLAGYLWTDDGELICNEDLVDGASFTLVLPERRHRVKVLERRTSFLLRLEIDGREVPAAFSESHSGPYIKLRIRDAIVSAAVCVLDVRKTQLEDLICIVREDNLLCEDTPMNILGFLRHIADLLLAEQVKGPGKIGLALGDVYDARTFVKTYTLEDVRDLFPGLFYEAIHRELLEVPPIGVDRNLQELIARTMLARPRPFCSDV